MPDPVVIAGGGIAGLAAAWELWRRGVPFLLLEAGPRFGGVIRTERVDGFVIEGGPDSILTQKPDGLALAAELGLGDRLLGTTAAARRLLVLHQGRLHPLPEGLVLGIPRRATAVLGTALLSWRGKLRLALEPFVRARRGGGDESIASFVRRRVGGEAARRLIEPLLAGIHAGDPERLSIHATFPRLADLEVKYGSLTRGLASAPAPKNTGPVFVSFPGGLLEMVEALLAQLPKHALRPSTSVRALRRTGTGFEVETGDGAPVRAAAVLLAVPAPFAASLLEGHAPDAARALRAIRFASSATVSLAYPAQALPRPLDASGVLVSRDEGLRSTAWTFVSAKFPSRAPEGTVLLRAFLGGTHDPQILDADDQALAATAHAEMAAALGIRGAPILTRVSRWPSATPQMEVGHGALVSTIEEGLAAAGPLAIAGGGVRATGLPDVIGDARRTVGALAARLAER